MPSSICLDVSVRIYTAWLYYLVLSGSIELNYIMSGHCYETADHANAISCLDLKAQLRQSNLSEEIKDELNFYYS